MEANPFHWSDWLSAEGMADVASFGSGSYGGQSGLDGCIHESYGNANKSHGYNTAGRNHLDLQGDSASVALQNGTTVGLGGTSNLEPLEAGFDPAPLQQTPDPVASSTKTGPDVSPQSFDDPRAFAPDQVCTCAACLKGYSCLAHLQSRRANPDCSSWVFGCRIAGCEWNTKDAFSRYDITLLTPLGKLWCHEKESSHYGKTGNWRCREANCNYATKRWGDLMRHSSSKHCINPKSYECPAIGCKYHQQGFTRKDKLNSHYQKVHGGHSQPGKPNQAIMPKGGERT